ncbi:MAG TPA: DUF1800 domain-containing protein [Bacteroidetes bacterium]|nr:DUF1800 domain-containing protein [Bacteroidota bacterium]
MLSEKIKIRHLYLRAGFGYTAAEDSEFDKQKLNEHIETLFKNSAVVEDLNFLPPPLKEGQEASTTKVLLLILRSVEEAQDLSMAWMRRMASTKASLRERMTMFWHNHFATNVPFAYLMQVQNNTLRKHALGNFREMVHAIAKDPAMINYLGSQQNHKDNPNENFARELMELFTLGVGHYTEKDVKESARAFTGWTIDRTGNYLFKVNDHDDGEKTFRGETGNFNGDEIIDMLLNDKQTALYITRKIYSEFVNEIVDEERVASLADDFFTSKYDIQKLMRSIFSSEWFYEEKNIGSKISSPVDFMIRLKKFTNISPKDDTVQVKFMTLLGQLLFFPPSVAGWKGGRNWIDGASLFLRMNLPLATKGKFKINATVKNAPEESGDSKPAQELLFTADWASLASVVSGESDKDLIDSASEKFLQTPLTEPEKEKLIALLSQSDSASKKTDAIVYVMTSPNFQLI